MLSLDPWTLFWTVFNILVLFLALKKFLFKPVLGVIEKRNSMIKQQFDEASNAKIQAEAMKEEYEQQLETAHEQAAEIITVARARAEEEHNQVIAQARKESQKMLEQAKSDIEYEQEKAKSASLAGRLADAKNEAAALKVNNDILKQKNLELEEKIKSLEWCIQERDKTIKDMREDNLRMYKKIEFSKELYRQFKWKCDTAMKTQFVTKTIKASELKQFLNMDDVISLYTLIGMAGK